MNRIPTSVPGSVAGIVMQIYRALFRLSEAPLAAVVGVEALDDVTTLTPDLLINFEQDKFSLAAEQAPITPRSEAFWKTFGIWADAWVRETLTAKSPTFLLATNRPVLGTLKELTNLNRGREVNAQILAELQKEKKLRPKPAKKSVQELINAVLTKPMDVLLGVIENLHIESGPSILDLGLVNRTIDRLHIPDFLDGTEVHRALYGWISEVIVAKWASGDQGWVTRIEFDRQLDKIKTMLVRQKITARAARVIPISDAEKSEARGHRFISHLAMIQMDPSRVDEELIHYLKFSKEKIRLLNDGYIPESEWVFRGDRLSEYWRTIFERHCFLRQEAEPPERIGMKIFYDAAQHREPLLDEAMPEAYMTLGHFHRLSNDDLIYWHPEFKKGKKN